MKEIGQMSRALPRCSGCRVSMPSAAAFLLLAVTASPLGARETAAPKLTFYPALQLRFVDGQARNYFFSQAQVVNVSGEPMTDLVLRQSFPEGFTARLLSGDAQATFKRPAGFSE